ncbi:hypothetical protein ACU5EH_25185 [Aliivibrio salmonicida]|uniref:hypothetical protein n=1 Tax=Aliivibrio salmonicida TaxID=40269 RepID=UPI00406C3902
MTDLKSIKNHSEQNFFSFKKQLRKCNRISQYVGIRFEISLAAFFVKKQVDYKNRESPDFEFKSGDRPLAFIETTSCHIVIEKPQNLYLKITSAIKAKSSKNYANNSTILAIDITNLVHNSPRFHSSFKIEHVIEECKSAINESSYGAFIFRLSFPNEQDGWIYSGGDSFIKEESSTSLKQLWHELGYDERIPQNIEHGTYFCA